MSDKDNNTHTWVCCNTSKTVWMLRKYYSALMKLNWSHYYLSNVTQSDKKGLIARVYLWVHSFKMLKCISLKFSQDTILCCWSLVCKMYWHRPFSKKVMSSQSQKSGKAISPFLSDRVTNVHCIRKMKAPLNN